MPISPLQVAVLVTSLLLAATKFFDCWTTVRHVAGPRGETNPWVRAVMERLGFERTIWLVFVVVLIVVVGTGGAAYRAAAPLGPPGSTSPPLPMIGATLYVALGVLIAAVQAAVAHTNYSGRFNPIARRLLRFHQSMDVRLGKWRRR